ncbi:MAG: alanine racemase [Thermoanaerobaculia bacterium]|jgi:D-serine deaminase-like pyridoxal phosphate-dependent protein
MTALLRIPTPAFVVDRSIAKANCDRMRTKALLAGVVFRPHVKTHKTIEGARMQHGEDDGPITVSTLAEADFFADAGFDDITWAVPLAPAKLERCLGIAKKARLILLVDHPVTVAALEEFAGSHDAAFDVMLKVDCGYHRAGVDPDARSSVELALAIARSERLRLRGLLTHAGQSYHARGAEEIVTIAATEREAVARLGATLADEGIQGLVRSVGSTPTMSVAPIAGVDEIRPGNYIFYDAFQAAIGSCRLSDCAVFVVATVIGVNEGRGECIVDAGALALSKDAGPAHVDPAFGYGVVCRLDGVPLPARVVSLSQEHGVIRWREEIGPLAIGDRLRIVPNHSCLAAALFDAYLVLDESEVVGEWRPCRGW